MGIISNLSPRSPGDPNWVTKLSPDMIVWILFKERRRSPAMFLWANGDLQEAPLTFCSGVGERILVGSTCGSIGPNLSAMQNCPKQFSSWAPGAILSLLQSSCKQSATALTHIRSTLDVRSISYTELQCNVEHVATVVGRLKASHHTDSTSLVSAHLNLLSTGNRPLAPVVVAICVEMGIPAIAMHLAVMNRNACIYIDPEKLTDQNSVSILAEVKPEFVIVDEGHWDHCIWLQRHKVEETIDVFGEKFLLVSMNQAASNPLEPPSDLAYIITTTGTTGAPKIVYVPWDCIAPNVSDFLHKFNITDSDVFFSAAPLSFDPSFVNMLSSIAGGAEMVVASKQALCSADTIRCLLGRLVTFIQVTPSLLALWNSQQPINMNLLASGSTVRAVALGGECLPHQGTLKCWFENARGVKLYNLYGITEVSSWSSIKNVCLDIVFGSNLAPCIRYGGQGQTAGASLYSDEEACHTTEAFDEQRDLGDAMSETVMCLVKNGTVLTEGEGEIFLGRRHGCLILERSSSNAKVFTVMDSNIFVNSVRLVPSGDSGCVINGCIYFKGRIGRVAKHFGQKISLIEIEQTCLRFPEIEACHVLYHEKVLFCFVLLHKNIVRSSKASKMLQHAIKVPCKIIMIDTVPINSHGKIDQNKLLSSVKGYPAEISMGAKNIISLIEDAWEDILLCKPEPGMNFLKAGGNSMQAVMLLQNIHENIHISVNQILDVLLNDNYAAFVHAILTLIRSLEPNSKICVNHTKNRYLNGLRLNKISVSDAKNDSHHGSPQNEPSISDIKNQLQNGLPEIRISINDTKNQLHHKVSPKSSTSIDETENHSHHGSSQNIASVTNPNNKSLDGSVVSPNPAKKAKRSELFAEVIISKLGYFERGIKLNPNETSFPKQSELVWSYDLMKCIDSSPVVVRVNSRTMLLVGSHSRLFCCLDAVSGTALWSVTLHGRMEASPALNASASRVYAGCYAGTLYCIRVTDGTVIWKFQTAAEVKSTPVVDFASGKIYFGSHDKHLYCLTEGGNFLWKVLHSGGSIFASPCLLEEHVIVACLRGDVGCYEKASGKLVWKCSISWPVFSSLTRFSRGVVTASVDKCVHAISFTGTVLWSYNTDDQCYCTPAVMLQGSREVIVGGNNKGSLFVLSNNGELLALLETGSKIVASPFLYTVATSIDGKFVCVVVTTDGTVLFVEWGPMSRSKEHVCKGTPPNTARKPTREWTDSDLPQHMTLNSQDHDSLTSKILLKFSLESELFSSPVVYDGRLYICGRDNMIRCFSLDA